MPMASPEFALAVAGTDTERQRAALSVRKVREKEWAMGILA